MQGFGGTNFGTRDDSSNNIISGSLNLGALGQGLNAGILNGTVTIPGLGTITNLAFLARALEQEVGANILSTPTLLTLDNEEARIIVGQNVPLVTGQYATTGRHLDGAAVPDHRAEGHRRAAAREAADHRGRHVRLIIYQEVSRIDNRSTTTQGLVLSKRALESSVIVDDQQVAVLGGLIQDSFTDGSDRVPAARRPADHRRVLPLRRAQAAEGEPAHLPQADRRAHRRAGQGAHVGALRVHHGRAARRTAPSIATSGTTRPRPCVPPSGLMPGTIDG